MKKWVSRIPPTLHTSTAASQNRQNDKKREQSISSVTSNEKISMKFQSRFARDERVPAWRRRVRPQEMLHVHGVVAKKRAGITRLTRFFDASNFILNFDARSFCQKPSFFVDHRRPRTSRAKLFLMKPLSRRCDQSSLSSPCDENWLLFPFFLTPSRLIPVFYCYFVGYSSSLTMWLDGVAI